MRLNPSQDDEMEIHGYKTSPFRLAVTYLLILLTGGALRLVYHWIPHWFLKSTSVPCPLTEAERILVIVSSGRVDRWILLTGLDFSGKVQRETRNTPRQTSTCLNARMCSKTAERRRHKATPHHGDRWCSAIAVRSLFRWRVYSCRKVRMTFGK